MPFKIQQNHNEKQQLILNKWPTKNWLTKESRRNAMVVDEMCNLAPLFFSSCINYLHQEA
jgi:hypothetical protein